MGQGLAGPLCSAGGEVLAKGICIQTKIVLPCKLGLTGSMTPVERSSRYYGEGYGIA
jgi:hypothetical protein